MCQYQTLYYDNKVGYVVRCPDCDQFQLGYGTVIMNLCHEDFTNFFKKVKSYAIELENKEQLSSIKSIAIPTASLGFNLFVSEREMQELFQMLDQADTEYQVQFLTTFLSC